MKDALIPIILVLAALAPPWLAGMDGDPSRPALLLAAPLLYIAGVRLGSLRGRQVISAASPGAAAQVVLGAFLLGGAAHAVIPPSVFGEPVGLGDSLLWGLALSIGEPPNPGMAAAPASRGAGRIHALLDAHGSMTAILGSVAAVIIARGDLSGRGNPILDPGSIAAGLALGLAAGAAVGLAVRALRGTIRGQALTGLFHLAAAIGAAVSTMAVDASVPAAVLLAGLIGGGPPRRHIDGRAVENPVAFPGAAPIGLLSAAGVLALAGARTDPGELWASLPAGALLWSGAVLLRLLVQFGFGGLRGWFRPRDIPLRWLPALGWASHPGALGAAVLILAAGGAPQGGPLPAVAAAPLWAIAIALVIQGISARSLLERAARFPVPVKSVERWERLLAASVALDAQRRTVEDLQKDGGLDEETLTSLRGAIDSGRRLVEEGLLETSAAHPHLRHQRLEAVVRAALAAGREAVAEGRERGWLSVEAAVEVERELSRRWSRTGSVHIQVLLGANLLETLPSGAGRRSEKAEG